MNRLGIYPTSRTTRYRLSLRFLSLLLIGILIGLNGFLVPVAVAQQTPKQKTKKESRSPQPGQPPPIQMGNFWALLIGIDEYAHWPKLSTPVRDVEALQGILIGHYGFSPNRVLSLTGREATREQIIGALRQLNHEESSPITENDSLLIYYGGHGELTNVSGYWVPVEAALDTEGAYISHSEIRDHIAAMKAKHVYLVVDSCFSGHLLASATRSKPPVITERYFQEAYKRISRAGLTAGGKEKVNDVGPDGQHSIFAFYFLKTLRENQERYLAASSIFDDIKVPISNNSQQTPIHMPLRDARDEGGEFIFVRIPPVNTLNPPPALPPVVLNGDREPFAERGLKGGISSEPPIKATDKTFEETSPDRPLLSPQEEPTSDAGLTLDSLKAFLKRLVVEPTRQKGQIPIPIPTP